MTDIAVIPHVNDMEDDIFKKHANKRHSADFLAPFTDIDTAAAVVDTARACHDYWHRTHPGAYDHEHLEET